MIHSNATVTIVYVLAAPEPAFQYEGGVRLVDGPYRSEGRLEVFIFDQWYTLCGTTISENAATAVCYQLGYTSSEGASEMYATMFVCVCTLNYSIYT